VIDASSNDTVSNSPVYVTISKDNAGDTGVDKCSVTASCDTDMFVYLVFSNLIKVAVMRFDRFITYQRFI
jgi:hypothetical protein